MSFTFDERPSDSPYVEVIWRTESERAGSFISTAVIHSEMVVTRYQGHLSLTVRGPETKATEAAIPPDAEFLGIRLKLGTFMPHMPNINLVDAPAIFPAAASKSFWLKGSAWEIPDFDNADTFIDRLVREGLLTHEPIVDAALQGQLPDLSLRSVQRRFLRATGLTHGLVVQIERAQRAMKLLQQGVSILDTVDQAGYADQPHLTRALKRLVGQTPAQILKVNTLG